MTLDELSKVTPVQSLQPSVSAIARVCHEANKAWCITNGDNSQKSWDDAPTWQKTSALNGVQFHLDNPDAGDSASHDSWMKEKLDAGWVYGELKDEIAKTHPCIVPFEQLSSEQQAKDRLFRGIVHSLK